MKNLLILSAMMMFISCGTKKQVATESNDTPGTTEAVVEQNRIVGTVRVAKTGCKVFIEAQMSKDKNDIMLMYPVNLDEKFHKEGMFIKFTYAESRAQQPEGCTADKVVSLSDVTPLRN